MALVLSSVFDVHRLPRQLWQAICDTEAEGRCRLPGFAGAGSTHTECVATIIESDPERLLRVRKDDAPDAGTEIMLRMSPANAGGWPTRVTLTQTGFDDAEARDARAVRWQRNVANFRLFLERGITLPAQAPALVVDLGIEPTQTDTGIVCGHIAADGPAARCGIVAGDLLLCVRGVRVYDIAQLWAVLAVTNIDSTVELTWASADGLRSAHTD